MLPRVRLLRQEHRSQTLGHALRQLPVRWPIDEFCSTSTALPEPRLSAPPLLTFKTPPQTRGFLSSAIDPAPLRTIHEYSSFAFRRENLRELYLRQFAKWCWVDGKADFP